MRKEKISKRKVRRIQAQDWEHGECFTFRGAGRVWWSYEDAKRGAGGRNVRRFDTRTDAEQWLFAMG